MKRRTPITLVDENKYDFLCAVSLSVQDISCAYKALTRVHRILIRTAFSRECPDARRELPESSEWPGLDSNLNLPPGHLSCNPARIAAKQS